MEKIKMRCGVYGEAVVFSVEMEPNTDVEALRKAIFDDQRYLERFSFPPSGLTLCVAWRNGVWLKNDENANDLLSREVDTTYKKMRTSWKLNDDECFGRDFQPEDNVVHVLVKPPARQYADPKLVELQESLLHHVLLDAPSRTPAQSQQFKANLCARYKCNMGGGKLRCMLLDTALPSELVIASHLFRHAFLSEKLMAFPDIDDTKNGLLLVEPLEHAYDHFQISFIFDQSSDEFRMKIFDRSLRPLRLFEKLGNPQRGKLLQGEVLPTNWGLEGPRDAPGINYGIQTTFGELEGRPLCFRSVERPYKRCLNLQARLARLKAIEEKWIKPDEDEFQDFWSEGMSLAEKMKFYHAKLA